MLATLKPHKWWNFARNPLEFMVSNEIFANSCQHVFSKETRKLSKHQNVSYYLGRVL